jgi:maleylacetate reductase
VTGDEATREVRDAAAPGADGATRGGDAPDMAELPGADGAPFTFSALVASARAVRVVFGPRSLGRVASEARSLGSRVFLISGGHAADVAAAVSADLGDALVDRFASVAQHVPVELASNAVAAAAASRADVVVSVGGGAATGLAKVVALETGLPILAVPTTFAGSEMTPIWGRTDRGRKTTGRDVRVLPRVVVYDPVLTSSMSAELTAASGMNALAHAIESLYAPDAAGPSTRVAEEAIRTLARGLPVAVREPDDLNGRAVALRGAWLAGWALGSTTMGLHHALAHALGGRFGLPHAGLHSALLPQVAAFNAAAAPEAFARAARALGVAGPEDVAPALFDLAVEIGAPTSLADLGLQRGDVAAAAAGVDPSRVASPRVFDGDDLRRLVRRAFDGQRPRPFPTTPGVPGEASRPSERSERRTSP